jgi:hypothetical protein
MAAASSAVTASALDCCVRLAIECHHPRGDTIPSSPMRRRAQTTRSDFRRRCEQGSGSPIAKGQPAAAGAVTGGRVNGQPSHSARCANSRPSIRLSFLE